MKLYCFKIIFLVTCLFSMNVFSASKGLDHNCIRREIDRLKEIRESDPLKYEHELCKYQKNLRAKMIQLQKDNPEEYREVRADFIRQKHLLLKENFDRYPEKRVKTYASYTNRLHNKLLFLKENDPESYEKLKARIEREQESRLTVNGEEQPNPFFDHISHDKHKRNMQRKTLEGEAKRAESSPEQRKKAKARLEKKANRKTGNF